MDRRLFLTASMTSGMIAATNSTTAAVELATQIEPQA